MFPRGVAFLVALTLCHAVAGAVLVDVTPSADDQTVEAFTTSQSKSTPDGKSQKVLTLTTVATVRSEKANGIVGTFNVKPEERYAIQLNIFKDISKSEKIVGNKALAIKTLAQPSELSSIPLHTDATVMNIQSSGALTFVDLNGKFSVLVTPEAARKKARPKGMYSLVGTPGTKLNLTRLRELKKGVPLLGKLFLPADTGDAFMQITDSGIELVNVTVTAAKSGTAK